MFRSFKLYFVFACNNYISIAFVRYEKLRLLDLPGLRKALPVSLDSFVKYTQATCQQAKHILSQQWIKECCNIVNDYRDCIEDDIHSDKMVSVLDHACVLRHRRGLSNT